MKYDTNNDLRLTIKAEDKEFLVDEVCCTSINIIMKNDGKIMTSFLGVHNPEIMKTLERALKAYFKGIKKTLKAKYKEEDCCCGDPNCHGECHHDHECHCHEEGHECHCHDDGKECHCHDDGHKCNCNHDDKKSHKKSKKSDCGCGDPNCHCGDDCKCHEGEKCSDGCTCADDKKPAKKKPTTSKSKQAGKKTNTVKTNKKK